MVVVPTEAEVLQNLCSKDQLELLNSIDTLRAQGISSFVSLPQIIVCGDQSSGKSSVLEAISGVPFPAKSTMCTRFPTELVLRKAKEEGVSVSIVADPGRKIEDRESISKFNGSQDVSDGVPALIEKAKAAMGILPEGKAFARDVLRIEVSGPDRPQLTIVDLPGLIHSPTKQQSAFDVDLVQQLVHEYMKKTRSVILAVVSAKNDYANQVVLKLARAADQKGYRSLGVITKPDMLVPSSSSERAFIQLANNEDVSFRLGWHVLKNMDTEKGQSTLRERDAQEREFFDTGVWTTLPPMHLGIGSLRQRLSKVLLDQIVMELPSLAKEIDSKSNECSRSLGQLGKARTTVMEQRAYLMQSSQEFQVLVKAAVDGTYNHTFFGDPNSNLGYRKRIRAIIQNMNIDFAADIMRRGQLQEIASENPKESSDERLNSSKKKITRKAYVERVIKLMERTRGRELPGTFNPMIVKDLFAEQCKPWHNIANNHIEGVWKAAKDFLGLVMSAIADEMTSKSVFQRVFTPALDSIWETLRTKTDELLATHHEGHPITYNHYFTENLQKIRSKNEKERFVRILREKLPVTDNGWIDGNLDIGEVADALLVRSEPDMDRFAALEAIDCMEAYYKVALKRFIDDLANEVIENVLMHKLESIFEPVASFTMKDSEVQRIAGESEESRIYRTSLEKKLEILQKGLDICKQHTAGRMTEKVIEDEHPVETLSNAAHKGGESLKEDVGPPQKSEAREEADHPPQLDSQGTGSVKSLQEKLSCDNLMIEMEPKGFELDRFGVMEAEDGSTWASFGLSNKKGKKDKKGKKVQSIIPEDESKEEVIRVWE